MKRLALMIVMLILSTITVSADESVKCDVVDYKIVVNGNFESINSSILSIDDSTYLPIRCISELLNLYVVWKEEPKIIEISDIGKTLEIDTLDNSLTSQNILAQKTDIKIKVDGYEKRTENSIIIVNDLAYLPVRELSEILGFNVIWDEESKTISIDKVLLEDKDEIRLYPFSQGDLWGYMDKNGDIKIPPQFQEANDFSEGLAVVGISYDNDYFNKHKFKQLDTDIAYGYINENGEFVLPPVYYEAYNFKEGLAPVVIKKGYDNKDIENGMFFESMGFFDFINTSGDTVISGDYPIAKPFNNGFAVVCQINGEYGFIDKDGGFKNTNCILYDLINGKYVSNKQVINTDLEIVFDGKEYDKINYISDKFIAVTKNGKMGLVDFNHDVIIDCKYEDIGYSSGENLLTFKENGKYGYMDLNENVIISPRYNYAWTFNDDIAIIWDDEKSSIINKQGELLVSDLGYRAYIDKIFSRDIIRIFNDDNIKYIDSHGKTIEPIS